MGVTGMEGRVMMWTEYAAKLKFDENKSWSTVALMVNDTYKTTLTSEQIRRRLRNHPRYKQSNTVVDTISNDSLLDALKRESSIEDLCEKFNVSKKILSAYVDDLKDNGYQIDSENDVLKLRKHLMPCENNHKIDWNGNKIVKFGVVADTHLGSKHTQLTLLKDLYKTFKAENTDFAFHVGDMTEGYYKNRPGHIYELVDGLAGASAQANYVIDKYPDDVPTKYILGNHDETHIMNGGFDISELISLKRPDMEFLGYCNATVNIAPNTTVELWHGKDGSSYAQSYALQKYLDCMMSGQKPNILLSGHRHKAFQMFYRNVFAFEAGTTQALTSFMRDKKLSAHVGGWIIEARIDIEGSIVGCKGEFFPLYTMKKDDY